MSYTTPDWLLIVIGLFIMVLAYWLARAYSQVRIMTANCAVLTSQVAALQAHPDSWQSGYNEGRRMGSKHGQEDIKRLNSGMIIITGRDEFGEPTRTHARGLNLRQLIDEAIEEHQS